VRNNSLADNVGLSSFV